MSSGVGPPGPTGSTGLTSPTTTLIVSSYNQPRPLELCLTALSVQTDPHFDVIVSDDGSEPGIEGVVDALRDRLPFECRCLTQPDQGFRKALAQNRAAARARGELLVFLDGDCIPFRNLVEIYRRCARPSEFFPGAVSYLDRQTTERLTPDLVKDGIHETSLSRREYLRLLRVHVRNRISGHRQSRPRLKGGNFAVAADLFRAVDGFDEVYCGYAREDSDLRNRMRNAGARGISLWHKARVCHIWWDRPWGKGREHPPEEVFEQGRRRVRARAGLSAHAS